MERVNPPPKASPFVKTTADKAGKAPFSDKRTEDFPGLC